jgi:hypothetical protein
VAQPERPRQAGQKAGLALEIESNGRFLMMGLSRLTVLAILTAALASAQYLNQEISGFVLDPTDAAVPKARVSVRHVGTGQERTTESDARGYYAFLNVTTGEYEIAAEAAGFKRYVQTGVVVTVSGKVTAAISLTVGDVRESVTVAANALQLDSSGGEIGREITGQQAIDLPLNGRNFAELLALMPGVSTLYASGMDLQMNANNSSQSVNGSRKSTLSWNIDGADNKDNGGQGNVFIRVNVDAIAEFKVLTSNYSAEYGQSSGAMVNIALKSGGRDFHGSPYGIFRTRNSNSGWNLGGPIYIPHRFNAAREKLFFFISQDFLTISPYYGGYSSVPALAQRNGDFSSVAAPVTDPMSGAAFPGNIIPPSRIDRNTSLLLAMAPNPNIPGNLTLYGYSYEIPTHDYQFLQKVDYHINGKHQLAVHYLRDNFYQEQGQLALRLYDHRIPGISSSAKWTWTPGARMVNTFQFSFSGKAITQNNFTPDSLYTNATDVTRQGSGVNNPMLFGNAQIVPNVSIQGYNFPSATSRDLRLFQRLFQWKDDFSIVAGAHILKFGALALRSRKNQGNNTPINGSINFQTGHSLSSGNAVADAVLGNFSTYTEASGTGMGWFRFTQAEFYAQDNWKVSRRLSFDLGVRAQYMQPQYSVLANDVVFDPAFYDPKLAVAVSAAGQIVPNSGDPLNGLVLGGAGFPKAALDRYPAWNNPATTRLFRGLPNTIQSWRMPIAPRLGFAYDLTGKQRTVLRGAYGLFFERIQGDAYFNSVNNPPFLQQPAISSGNIENPSKGVTVALLPSNVYSYAADAAIPMVQQYNLGIQQRLGRDTLLDVSYVGSSSRRQYQGTLPNQLRAGAMLRVPEGADPNSVRPYPGLANITQLSTGANSNYNSLQVQLRKQMLTGGMFGIAYTWSRNITNATDYNSLPQDTYNLGAERGLSGFHRGQVVSASYVYPLPFWQKGEGWYRWLFGDWKFSGTIMLETGLPLNIYAAGDPAGIASTGGSLRPDVVGDWRVSSQTSQQWFNTAAFRTPAPGTFGNLGRGVLIGPGMSNWNAGFQKIFRLSEAFSVSYRLDYYNLLDSTYRLGVDGSMASSLFGHVNSTSNGWRGLGSSFRLTF